MRLLPFGGLRILRVVAMSVCGIAIMQLSALAAPHNGDEFTFRQGDGSELELKGYGDEFHMRFETADGYTVIRDDAQGMFCYAKRSKDGRQLVSTGVPVGRAVPAGLRKHIDLTRVATRKIRSELRHKWTSQMDCVKSWDAMKAAAQRDNGAFASPPDSKTLGELFGLTVLVDFPDDPGAITVEQVRDFCNKVGYNENGNNGSVYDYFLNNSNKLLKYTNVVVGYYRAKNKKDYYNKRESNVLVEEVAAYLKNNPPPDLAKISTYPGGNCRAVNIYFAGDSPESSSAGLWPHAHEIDAVDIGGGKKIKDYQMTNMGKSLKIGVFCHENGHLICGYPDIYCGDSDTGGAGNFCLMDSAGSGPNPSQICAYLKYKSGWGSVTTITGSKTMTGNKIYKSGTGGDGNVGNQFYLYQRPGVATEYYLIENRQKSGNDSDLPAAGLAVWHVDELGGRSKSNYSYNATHNNFEATLMQADNLWHFENNKNAGDAQDLFYAGNTATGYTNAFTDTSALCSKWWDGTSSKLSITSISASGDTMTFDASGADAYTVTGKLNGPVASGVTVFLAQAPPTSGRAEAGAPVYTLFTKTAADGSYAFNGLANGRYTITPRYSGAAFTPPTVEVALEDGDEDGEDFASSGADAGSLVITAPVGGEEWMTGSIPSITWNSTGVEGGVVIEALKGGVAYKTIDDAADNLESYEWELDRSYDSGSDYQTKISSADNPSVSWTSDMFSIGHPVMRATAGSTFDMADAFDTKPKLFADIDGKRKEAKIVLWKDGGTTFTWTAAVPPGTYTLYAEQKGQEAHVITDSFEVMEPVIEGNAAPEIDGKYYTMKFFGITGAKPKLWWNYGEGKKLNCAVVEYEQADFTEPGASASDLQEAILVKFKADVFDEFAPTMITIKNSIGQTDYQVNSSGE